MPPPDVVRRAPVCPEVLTFLAPGGELSVFMVNISGSTRQYALRNDGTGYLTAERLRTIDVGSIDVGSIDVETEGIAWQGDGCSRTGGVAATGRSLGPDFANGAFSCQDDDNTTPGQAGNQASS